MSRWINSIEKWTLLEGKSTFPKYKKTPFKRVTNDVRPRSEAVIGLVWLGPVGWTWLWWNVCAGWIHGHTPCTDERVDQGNRHRWRWEYPIHWILEIFKRHQQLLKEV